MASIEDVKNVLKETLDNRGVLNQIRARIRAEVFSALDDETDSKPILSNENMFINELIREYLEFNKYKYANSVLLSESGQPKEAIDRNFLAAELNIKENDTADKLPLLYGLVSYFLEHKHVATKKQRSPRGSARSPQGSVRSTRGSVRREKRTSVSSNDEQQEEKSYQNGIVYHAKK